MKDRICLLDQIKNKEIDFDKAIKLVTEILQEVYYQLDKFYIRSRYCVLGKTLEDAISAITKNKGNGLHEFLNFYELINSLLFVYHLNGYCDDDEIGQIQQILDLNLEKSGWCCDLNFETHQVTLRRKDFKAELVADTQTLSVQDKIYGYLSIHNGMIKEKRESLKSLIDEVEVFCKTKSSIKEIDKTKQFYQCVRHSKTEPKKEFPFYYKDEEKWLDCIFQMVLDVLAFKDLGDKVKDVISEENKGQH